MGASGCTQLQEAFVTRAVSFSEQDAATVLLSIQPHLREQEPDIMILYLL